MTKHPNRLGVYSARPIYDWEDGDVWKAILDNKLPYNPVYDVLLRMGVSKRKLRMAVPVGSLGQLEPLQAIAKARPRWFERLCNRLPGVRQAVLYGEKSMMPVVHPGEKWSECFWRNMKDPNIPQWIKNQGMDAYKQATNMHKRHAANSPFPEEPPCNQCGQLGMWKRIVQKLFTPCAMGSFVTKVPYGRDFRPDFYHPTLADLKADPAYDQEGLYFSEEERDARQKELEQQEVS